jgi:hypothetical protein
MYINKALLSEFIPSFFFTFSLKKWIKTGAKNTLIFSGY